ncbi:peptidoglycan-binding protein [Streptomyces sp. NPDC059479]|uniref:peptidoglycan-binding domain-containing protein n=1 Tax=Streptomyces sp. NPDC059479 TaxID=3346848 RepID=UPI003690A260
MTGQLCPECGTPRAADDRPGCACAERPGAVSPESAAESAAETTMALTKITAAAAPVPPGVSPGTTPGASRNAQPADTRKAEGAPEAVAPGAVEGADKQVCARESGQPTEDQQAARQVAAQEIAEERAEASAQEIAEAEDFNPLRVRPYVTLDAGDDRTEPPPPFRTAGPMPPLTPAANSATPPPARFYPPPPPRRRAPYRALAIGAAALAVIGTAAFAGGLFSSGEPGERALPDGTRDLPTVGVTEAEPSDSQTTPAPSGSSLSSIGAALSPSPTASTVPSATASATTSAEQQPSAPPSSVAPKDSPSPTRQPSRQPPPAPDGTSLGPGDSGPEVVELQNRLEEVWLFRGPTDGQYDQRVEGAVRIYQSYRHIEGDPEGVYGPNTRRALEAETKGHGRRH